MRASIAELLELAEEIDRRIDPIDRELRPLALKDERVKLLRTIPGVGPLLGLTLAAEIGEVARFPGPGKLVGYAGLAPRVSQSGKRSADRGLAHALPPRALQPCPGKLLRFLTARRSCMELRPRGSSQERSAPRAPKEK